MSSAAGCLWGLLPVVVEGNQFPLKENECGLVKNIHNLEEQSIYSVVEI